MNPAVIAIYMLAACCTAPVSPAFAAAPAIQEHEHGMEQMHMEGTVSKKYIVKLETTQHKQYCQATTSIEYIQNNEVASVSGEIVNGDCAASSGTYTINIRFRDQSGELHDIDIDESWQRDDDRTINFSREYEIGRNVDLIGVKARRMTCVCAQVEAEEARKDQIDNQE